MQNVRKLLEISAYVVMFCTAVLLLLYSERALSRLIISTKDKISNNHILYEKYRTYEEINENKTTYAEIIAMLFGDLDYDVQINDLVISKSNYNYKSFDFSVIVQTDYIKSYQYDTSGDIVKVILISI